MNRRGGKGERVKEGERDEEEGGGHFTQPILTLTAFFWAAARNLLRGGVYSVPPKFRF